MAKRILVITGDKKLTRMLNALGSQKARAVHRKAIRKAARPILAEAKATGPVKTGKLRASLTIKAAKRSRKSIGVMVTQKAGAYKGDTFYGSFQELGWRTGRAKQKSNRERKKIPGKWTMRQAAIDKQDEAIEIYETEVNTLIESEARK